MYPIWVHHFKVTLRRRGSALGSGAQVVSGMEDARTGCPDSRPRGLFPIALLSHCLAFSEVLSGETSIRFALESLSAAPIASLCVANANQIVLF